MLMQGLLPAIMLFIAYRLVAPQKNLEARLQVKKEALLEALNVLDAQASYYFKNQGAVLQKEQMKTIRATFNKLLICTHNPAIPKKFAEFFFYKSKDNELNNPHITMFNDFRNLIRTELNLPKIDFKAYPFKDASYFAYVDCAEEKKPLEGKTTKENKTASNLK
jgi:hypothetical protein